MEEKSKYVDKVFHFKGEWEMPSLCGLKIKETDHEIMVVLTEMYVENPGSSVTSMIEKVATDVTNGYSLNPDRTIFVVHNPQRSERYEFFAESFYEAMMRWDGERFTDVKWKKIDSPGIDRF